MNTNRRIAIVVGALFLIAIVTSLVGAGLIESALGTPMNLTDVSSNETLLRIGVLLEVINGIAVVGIAVLMFPILKRQNEGLALGYVGFRIIEAVIIFAAVISPLTLIALSQDFVAAGTADVSIFQPLGSSLMDIRAHLVGQMIGLFFSLGALLFYYLLYQLDLVPRFISVWGLIAVVLVFAWNLLELMGIGISAGIVFGLPIILNEIFLGIWLIAKGFNAKEAVARPVVAV